MRGDAMRDTTRILLLTAALIGLSGAARAESIFGLSYFGRETLTSDARVEARAGMGLAYTDSMNASVLHAAQLADLQRVTIGLTSQFQTVRAEDDFGQVTRRGISVPVIRAGFPLPGHGGLGFGFVATRATQWTLIRPWDQATDLTQPYPRETIEREGTLFDVPVQVAFRFFDRLAVGTGVHFRGGAVRMRYDIDEYDPSRRRATRSIQSEIRDDTYWGWTPELSVSVSQIGPLSVAGYWLPEYEADVDVLQATRRDPQDQPTSRTDTMPQRFGAGLRLQLPARLSLGADFTLEDWSAYEGRSFTYDAEGRFDPQGEALPMKDERAFRVGLERESVRVGLRYTVPLRLGYYQRDWNYQVAGEDLREWGITLGSGLALRGGLSRIDFAAGYSQTGSRSDNGVTESMWTLTFSVAGAESWY